MNIPNINREHILDMLNNFHKVCPPFIFSFVNENRLKVTFFYALFYLDLTPYFYVEFYWNLISKLILTKPSTFPTLKNNSSYQSFWQFAIKNDFIFFFNSLEIQEEYFLLSFSNETLELYQSMKTLYELKNSTIILEEDNYF